MKLLREYLITLFSELAAVQYISEFITFMVHLTRGGRRFLLHIHTEGMGKILTNNFGTNYCS
jgi:hypothetical protein